MWRSVFCANERGCLRRSHISGDDDVDDVGDVDSQLTPRVRSSEKS